MIKFANPQWRNQFIESGTDGFKHKPDDSKLNAADRKIGQ